MVKIYNLYSIIDIEATGGNAQIGRITEIAIYKYDGKKIVDEFTSLVNPEMRIPHYVQKLTGISNKMVKEAPLFKDIAQQVYDFLQESYFVAHNVKADYSFIQTELKRAGINYKSERLCTLELSTRLIPEVDSHGLGKVCDFLGINVPDRHRASGDALATVELFKHLQSVDQNELIQRLIRKK